MDKGAHFHRCDFQVHTPRDQRWQGAGAVTPDERRDFSEELIKACRDRGLDAIAITDHHDMALVPWVRTAAAAELGPDNGPLPSEQKLTVFPGMELTLGIPCQALLLFDADFPEDLFGLVYNALAITQIATEEARLPGVERLNINSLADLHGLLDRHAYLKGRYIVLPNVSDGGSSTLLRSGHVLHYKEMPSVGGYIDGSFDQLGTGNRQILSGRDHQYGPKAIGIFQTSDNRRRDFADLGRATTWIKWAQPTAEALRQACLAKESRICQRVPYTPTVVISSLHVTNSRFLGPVYLELNSQYNAIIGGRGTGKSTLLEYLRWALCDEPIGADEDEDAAHPQVRRRRLIERTLSTVAGTVQVNFTLNGVPHAVRRNATGDDRLQLQIGNAPFESCSEAHVKQLLPIQAYSQKQLSGVGVRIEELKRFVRQPISRELQEIEVGLAATARQLRAEYERVQTARASRRELDDSDRQLRSASDQVGILRSTLSGIGEHHKAVVELQPKYEEADLIVDSWVDDLNIMVESIGECLASVRALPTLPAQPLSGLPEYTTLRDLQAAIHELLRTVQENLTATEVVANERVASDGTVGAAVTAYRERRDVFAAEYDAAKQASTSHLSTITALAELEGRVRAIHERQAVVRRELDGVASAAEAYSQLRVEWTNLHRSRGDAIEAQAARLSELSGGLIRATVKRCAGTSSMVERFRAVTAGTNVRSSRIEQLCQDLSTCADPIALWSEMLGEFAELIEQKENVSSGLPPTPRLVAAGFTPNELNRIALRLSRNDWLDLSLVVLEDEPAFEYRTGEGAHIPFADASAGQQATALLWALLGQDGPPLIIDQPEDDLDNQVILQVASQVWQAKKRRQLIFSSHNANLVVNGDAELIVCCAYRVVGDQSVGVVKREGGIDEAPIRDEITSVMEGGRAAFKLRMDKYGF